MQVRELKITHEMKLLTIEDEHACIVADLAAKHVTEMDSLRALVHQKEECIRELEAEVEELNRQSIVLAINLLSSDTVVDALAVATDSVDDISRQHHQTAAAAAAVMSCALSDSEHRCSKIVELEESLKASPDAEVEAEAEAAEVLLQTRHTQRRHEAGVLSSLQPLVSSVDLPPLVSSVDLPPLVSSVDLQPLVSSVDLQPLLASGGVVEAGVDTTTADPLSITHSGDGMPVPSSPSLPLQPPPLPPPLPPPPPLPSALLSPTTSSASSPTSSPLAPSSENSSLLFPSSPAVVRFPLPAASPFNLKNEDNTSEDNNEGSSMDKQEERPPPTPGQGRKKKKKKRAKNKKT
jgi:hypothetical protein